MLKALKQHWFGFLVTVGMLYYLGIFLLVILSPRQDNLNRGFIPCTKTMTQKLLSCEKNKTWCMSKAIIANGYCDSLVVLDGLGAWIRGQQPTPWANYLFTPQTTPADSEEIPEELREFYTEYPDTITDMKKLNIERQKLEDQLEMENYVNEETQF